jgi:hypothetical protein
MTRILRRLLVASSCAFLGLWFVPSLGRSHAVVMRASLRETAVVAESATRVRLEFNSAIEAKLAKVTLVDEQGGERPLEPAPGEHPKNQLVVALPPLAAGRYALRYKVLAVDGHVTESVLRFDVTARP